MVWWWCVCVWVVTDGLACSLLFVVCCLLFVATFHETTTTTTTCRVGCIVVQGYREAKKKVRTDCDTFVERIPCGDGKLRRSPSVPVHEFERFQKTQKRPHRPQETGHVLLVVLQRQTHGIEKKVRGIILLIVQKVQLFPPITSRNTVFKYFFGSILWSCFLFLLSLGT